MIGRVAFTGFVVILGLCYLTEVNGLDCLSCDRAPNITDCLSTTAACKDGEEQCFLDKTILPDLSAVFTAGCRAKLICDLIQSASGKRSVDKRDNVACAQCCGTTANATGIPCNGYLCNQSPVLPTDTCAVCDSIGNYTLCAVSQQCPSNEMCQLKQKIVGGGIVYELGCEQKSQCDRTLKIYRQTHNSKKSDHGVIDICSACCEGRNCNKEDTCQNLIKKQKCTEPSACDP